MRGIEHRLARRVAWLMLARVLLLLGVLGGTVVLGEATAAVPSGAEGRVLQAVLAGMSATVVSGLVLRRFRSVLAFGALQVGLDVGVATAIIHWTGGADSVFTFLYVLIVAYAALLFDRRLSLATAVGASLVYAGALAAAARGWGVAEPALPPSPLLLALTDAGVKAAALLVVAALASGLSRELARADRALDERTRDFGRLQDLHELTVQSLGSGLLTTDLGGIVRSFNREAQRITGLAADRVLGRRLEDVLPGSAGLVAASTARQRERMPFERPDGGFLHLGMATSVLRDEEGCAAGHVTIFQDITAIVEMEDELRRSERLAAVGELAAGIAHEVRNPLASVSGCVQMMRAALAEEDVEQRRLMDIVLRETDRLDALITDFLLYARPAPPKLEPVSLAALAGELEEMYEAVRPGGVEASFHVDPETRVQADGDQLRQLLWNLLLNAGQAMPGGGHLVLAAGRVPPQEAAGSDRNPEDGEEAPRVEICVSDTGTGIPPEALDRIFDPFFTTKPEGSGLGLAMVHRIVEANGGQIGVESELGAGTRLRIRLPAAPPPEGTGQDPVLEGTA